MKKVKIHIQEDDKVAIEAFKNDPRVVIHKSISKPTDGGFLSWIGHVLFDWFPMAYSKNCKYCKNYLP